MVYADGSNPSGRKALGVRLPSRARIGSGTSSGREKGPAYLRRALPFVSAGQAVTLASGLILCTRRLLVLPGTPIGEGVRRFVDWFRAWEAVPSSARA